MMRVEHEYDRAGALATLLPGIGYHPRHAQRAWRDIVDLLAECVPITQ
jgi:hypothetical protein